VRSRFGNSDEGNANHNRHHGNGDQQLDRAKTQFSILRFRFHPFAIDVYLLPAPEGGLQNNPRRSEEQRACLCLPQ